MFLSWAGKARFIFPEAYNCIERGELDFFLKMDPIERIATDFTLHCISSLNVYVEMERILNTSETNAIAFKLLEKKNYMLFIDEEDLGCIAFEIGRLRRCIESMEEIKHMARKVFAVNFSRVDSVYIFNQEVCFSYACKLLAHIGPTLVHFSNNPTRNELVHAELSLACNTPLMVTSPESELLCLETMPQKRQRS